MSLRHSYRLLAPFYDWVAGPLFERARRVSIARLPAEAARVVKPGGCLLILDASPLVIAGDGLDIALAARPRPPDDEQQQREGDACFEQQPEQRFHNSARYTSRP